MVPPNPSDLGLHIRLVYMVWAKIAKVFSFSSQWGDNTVRLVEGKDASAMLKRVESLLEDSMRVLASHEPLLSQGEFNTFSVKHRNLLLRVVEVKQEVHDQQTQGTLSANPAGRQPLHLDQEISRLYKQARIYHRDVITASRRAQAQGEVAWDEFHNVDSKPGSSQALEPSDPTPTWYSIIAPSTRSPTVERQPYLAVAHVRPKGSESTGSTESADDETYREILILESNEKTVIMFNPNRRYLSRESDSFDELSLLEMSRAGEALLQATNPQALQGYEVVGAQHETSWADSFINTLSRLGVGIGADMM